MGPKAATEGEAEAILERDFERERILRVIERWVVVLKQNVYT